MIQKSKQTNFLEKKFNEIEKQKLNKKQTMKKGENNREKEPRIIRKEFLFGPTKYDVCTDSILT